MTADRVYAALLLLYPKPFRNEYGDEMAAAFRAMRERRRSSPLRFWTFVVADTIVAVARERLEGARWLATSVFGLLVTTGTAHAVAFTYQYFYHPYFEGATIPIVPYGLALGLVLGASVGLAQWLLFPAHEQRATRWALMSATTLPIAVLFCGSAIEHVLDGLNPLVVQTHPYALDVLVLGLARANTWTDLAAQFSAMAASALIVRAFMLMPLKGRHAH